MKKKGFTTIELIIVLVIIGIVTALAIPMYKNRVMSKPVYIKILSGANKAEYSMHYKFNMTLRFKEKNRDVDLSKLNKNLKELIDRHIDSAIQDSKQ